MGEALTAVSARNAEGKGNCVRQSRARLTWWADGPVQLAGSMEILLLRYRLSPGPSRGEDPNGQPCWRCSTSTQGNVPEDVLGDAVKFLDEYRGACQKQYIAFNRVCNGRHLGYDRYKSASNPANMDNTIFIGTAFPNSPISKQSPGSSTIATMKIREFLEGPAEGGGI